jgi:Ser/Thr protein kinase RdoA (MazF antagonist)
MWLANLAIERSNAPLFSFDDCILGWFFYGFATALSFVKDDMAVSALQTAWIMGYLNCAPSAQRTKIQWLLSGVCVIKFSQVGVQAK